MIELMTIKHYPSLCGKARPRSSSEIPDQRGIAQGQTALGQGLAGPEPRALERDSAPFGRQTAAAQTPAGIGNRLSYGQAPEIPQPRGAGGSPQREPPQVAGSEPGEMAGDPGPELSAAQTEEEP
jgi:hypothetical protein